MESQRREGMISSDMTKRIWKEIVKARHGKGLMGNTKKDWKLGGIRAAGDMGRTGTTLADFLLQI